MHIAASPVVARAPGRYQSTPFPFGEASTVRALHLERLPILTARTVWETPDTREAAPLVSSEIWVDGNHRMPPPMLPEAPPFDLASNPVVALRTSRDAVRLYISQGSLDQLDYDHGLRRVSGVLSPSRDGRDEVMHGLAQTLVSVMERPDRASALFAEYAALAFHVHVIRTYGRTSRIGQETQGGLAPWQVRRAHAFIDAHLGDDPSIALLAAECGLSASHFARAFKQSTGSPPHQWLTMRRVARAKDLLQETGMELAEIALACGFVDQSHLTRVFTRSEGQSPGKWRRLRRM